MKKETLIKIMSHLFSALLTVSLFFALVATTLCVTVLNKNYVLFTLDNTKYTEHLTGDIIAKLKTLSAASGVEESFFDTAVDADLVNQDALGFINAAVSAGNTAQYREDIRTAFDLQLKEKLVAYAQGSGFEISESVDEALTHLSSVCADYYVKFTAGNIMGTMFSMLSAVSDKLSVLIFAAIAVLALIAAISYIYARRLDKQNITKALIATGFTTAIIPLAVLLTRLIQRLGVEGAGMRAFFSGYIGTFVMILAIASVIMFVLAGLNYYMTVKRSTAVR